MKLFSNDYKIVDNIFSNPHDVVEFANQQGYSLATDNPYATGNYAGRRSQAIHDINKDAFEKLCRIIMLPNIVRAKYEDVSWNISMYFSRIYAIDKPKANQIHTDQECIKAGIIYLKENINPDSGTILYNDNDKKLKECKNKFNRGFFYNPNIKHAPAKFVDDRLTIVFFIRQLRVKDREYTLEDLN